MKTVNLQRIVEPTSSDYSRVMRVSRNVRLIYGITRFGSKAFTKVNPAMVYIDAFLSVVDAVDSYFTYKKAVEQTKQLTLQLEAYESELEALKIQLNKIYETEKQSLELHKEQIERKIEIQKEEDELMKKLYDQSGKHLELIGNLLQEIKKHYLSDEQLREIENKYYEALHARLEITIKILGG